MLLYEDIIKEDNLDLRKQSVEVKLPLSNEDKQTLLDMNEYLENGYQEELVKKYHLRPGVGIAAPQIDILKKMFVILAYDEKNILHHYGVINPKILSYSEELTYLESGEGCLSVDRKVDGLVHRPKRIKVTFDSYDFTTGEINKVTIRLKNYIAVVFQHEYDHLFGHLFIDRIRKDQPFYVPSNSTPIQFTSEEE